MTILETQQEIIDEFSVFEDWMDRYSLIIDYGNQLPSFPEDQRTEQNLIDGCQSKVWLTAHIEDGNIIFQGDSDALLVKGIVALLIRVFSGHSAQEIVDAQLTFIDAIHLSEHLSPTRNNGLVSMLKQMKLYAMTFLAK